MNRDLCTRAQFAEKCGVGVPAVIKSLRTCLQGVLYENYIDQNHPRAVAYYEYHRNKKTNYYSNRSYWNIVKLYREDNNIKPHQILNKMGKNIRDIKEIYELAKIETLPLPDGSSKSSSTSSKSLSESLSKKTEESGALIHDGTTAKPASYPIPFPKLEDENLQPILKPAEMPPSPSIKNSVQKITPDTIPDDIRDVKKMTIEEVVETFGTKLDYKLYVDAVKNIELIHEKRLKNARTMGLLVSKELVKVGIIDRVNAAHIKLLTDGMKTMAVRVEAMVHAGRNRQEIQKFMTDQTSSFIKPMKSKIDMSFENIERLTSL